MLYQSLSQSIDAVSVPCRGMFNKETIGKMKKGAYLINTARGGICDRDAVAEALESGQLLGDFNFRQSNIDHFAPSYVAENQYSTHSACLLLPVWLLWWAIHLRLVGMWLLMLYIGLHHANGIEVQVTSFCLLAKCV